MKRFFLFLMILNASSIYAQTGSKQQFEQFLQKFDLNDYPIVFSFDFSKMTEVIKTQGGVVDEKLLNLFVYGQGIETDDYLIGYNAYIQLPPTDSAFVLTLNQSMSDPAFGEGLLLTTYSKVDYRIKDTLWVFLRDGMVAQYIDDQKVTGRIEIESLLTKDSICTERKKIYYLKYNNVPKGSLSSKKIKITTYFTTYQMTVGGKFIKIRERREDEILDTIANKLK
jgi:hypothetical protein